jgi:hypothetical protein
MEERIQTQFVVTYRCVIDISIYKNICNKTNRFEVLVNYFHGDIFLTQMLAGIAGHCCSNRIVTLIPCGLLYPHNSMQSALILLERNFPSLPLCALQMKHDNGRVTSFRAYTESQLQKFRCCVIILSNFTVLSPTPHAQHCVFATCQHLAQSYY